MTATTASFSDLAEPSRRDFLMLTTVALGTVGVGMAASSLVRSLNPSADALAAGSPIDVNLDGIQPGQQIVVMWRGAPIFVVHRESAGIAQLDDAAHLAQLRDPDSVAHQQPKYAANAHRSVREDFAVLVGICTHLGCIPTFKKELVRSDSAASAGGYFCACHGSKYDLAGRVFKGVPAPYNLPVPPHHFVNDSMLRVGENPPGENYDFTSIEQI